MQPLNGIQFCENTQWCVFLGSEMVFIINIMTRGHLTFCLIFTQLAAEQEKANSFKCHEVSPPSSFCSPGPYISLPNST